MVWELTRFESKGIHIVPAWSGFNAMKSDKAVPVATVMYLHACATYRPLHYIYDLAEVGEAGAASHSRH